MRAFLCSAAVSLIAIPGSAQPLPLPSIASLRIPARVDTFDRCTQARGEPIRVCGNPYVRIVERAANGAYEVRNEYPDSTGKRETLQITRTTPRLAVLYARVQDTRDSAALVIASGAVSAWVATPTGTHLVGMDTAVSRYALDLVEQALALANPTRGQFVALPVGNLYGPDPSGVVIDTLRVEGRSSLSLNGRRVAAVVVRRRNGLVSWIDGVTGRILARRGNAGPTTFFWHFARSARAELIEQLTQRLD